MLNAVSCSYTRTGSFRVLSDVVDGVSVFAGFKVSLQEPACNFFCASLRRERGEDGLRPM
jgi:hypothetical protein